MSEVYNKKEYVPFDQYQRYETVARLIECRRQNLSANKFYILELGANEHKDLQMFLPNDKILFTDIVLTEKMQLDKDFQQADGTDLPFADNSFDFVIATDVLEHIPVDKRQAFINEAYRVAKIDVILSFPYASSDVIASEERVNSYYKAISGEDFIWLKEHRENGLPKLQEINQILNDISCKFFSFFHGDLKIWEKMWYCHFNTVFMPETLEFRTNIDNYYNTGIYDGDVSDSCYRVFYVLSKDDLHNIQKTVDLFRRDSQKRNVDFLDNLLSSHDNIHKLYIQRQKDDCTNINMLGKVYFDCGEGLSEESSKQFVIDEDNRIKLKVDLPDNCRAIRIDPVEGYGCLVWNLQVRTESQFLQVASHNGVALNEVYVFRTTDPQIYLENLPVGSRWLEIEAEIVCFEQAAWTKLVQEIEAEQQRKAALQGEKESLARSYEQKIADNLQAYEQNMQEQKQQFESDVLILRQQCEEEKVEIENNFRQILLKKNQILLDVQQQDKTQYDKLQQELEKITAQEQNVQNELAQYKEHYAAAMSQRDDLQGQLAAAQNAYNVISNAFFWKITKPARLFMDCVKYPFKKSRHMRLVGKGLRCLKENGVHYTWNKVQQKLKHQQDFAKAALSAYSDADLAKQRQTQFARDIKFSILTPLYNTPEKFLCEMIQSVIDQTYGNWELCLADGSDEQHKYVGKICRQYAKKDSRVKYKKLEQNLGISDNTNACIEMSTGDYIGLLDHDDLLHPAALYESMQTICNQNADFIYTDEATFASPNINKIITAHFKPDFAPDNLRANNYICHFSVFSRKIIDIIQGFSSEYDGSQDHDFILRATEQAKKIIHIPKILYYWRSHPNSVSEDIGAKLYAIDAGKRAVRDHIKRFGMNADVESSYAFPTIYHIQYDILEEPLVSIIIPNRNHYNDLRRCIESIISLTTYKKYEVIIVDNGSNELDILNYYSELKKFNNIRIIEWDYPFNFSAVNNFAAQYAMGDYLLFLNSDTKVITPEWIDEMLMYAQRQDVGAVGAKLYYEDDTIQHAGIILGLGAHRVAGHAFHRFAKGDVGYMGRLYFAQNYSAVTAACVMIRKTVWHEIDGFDESFAVAYNDVDLCMRIRKAGYLIVWTPYAELYHYESKSRGYDDTSEKKQRLESEANRFKLIWNKELSAGDPYYNPNLTLDKGDFSLR